MIMYKLITFTKGRHKNLSSLFFKIDEMSGANKAKLVEKIEELRKK